MTSKMRQTSKHSPWHQKACHDVHNIVIMSKTRYDVKRFVMTSKMRQIFRSKVKKKLWRQKVCQKYAITSKKFVITSKTCYDIKEFVMTSETRFHYIPKVIKNYVRMTKNLVKGLVMR